MGPYTGLSQIIERNAQVFHDQTALYTPSGGQSWLQTRNRIAALGKGLVNLGAKKNDKISILALNSHRYYETCFTSFWMGGIMVPLNTRWSAKENIYAIDDSSASVLFFDDNYLELTKEIKEEARSLKIFIYMGDKECPDWATSYESLATSDDMMDSAKVGGFEMAAIMYTGGTTGQPKGVMLSHQGIWSSGISLALELGLKAGDTYLHAAPMFHVADLSGGIATSIKGVAQAFIPSFNPVATLKAIEDHKITHILLVPTMIKMLIASPELQDFDVSSVRLLLYGASPMPEGTLLQVIDKLPHVGLMQALGQTELSPIITVLLPTDHIVGEKQIRSVGRPSASSHIRMRKEDGTLCKTGETGEIEVSGPHVMLGYLNKPEATAETLVDGYVRTGDVGYYDENGFVYISDRVKDMIITGGENVFSTEVENTISLHPAVKDVVVIGIPHEEWGEAVHALVICQDGAQVSESEIIAHCKQEIAGYKCPKTVEFRTEAFPVSAAGKTLKVELRKPYWAGTTRGVN